MNDSTSILLATTILALGGLGLYMYKTNHDEEEDGDNKDIRDNEEESTFDLSNLLNWGDSDDKDKNEDKTEDKTEDKNEHVEEALLDSESEGSHVKSRKKNSAKTQRNKKPSGSSRRRYY